MPWLIDDSMGDNVCFFVLYMEELADRVIYEMCACMVPASLHLSKMFDGT